MVKNLIKNNKKLFATALLLITIISNLIPVSNAANDYIDIYTNGSSSDLLQFDNDYYLVVYNAYKQNNEEYWVYNANYPVYNYSNPDPLTKQKIEKNSELYNVIINGFPYKTIEELGCKSFEEAYTATQTAIYCVYCSHDENAYTYFEGNDASIRTYNAFHKILDYARNVNIVDNEEPERILKLVDGEATIEGNYYLSKEYKIRSNYSIDSYDVEIEGFDTAVIVDENNDRRTTFNGKEGFKVLLPIEDLTQNGEYELKISTNKESNDMYLTSTIDGENMYILTGVPAEKEIDTFNISYDENISSINITVRAQDTNVEIENSLVNLLDKDKNIICTYTSDEKGKIHFEHLIPGKYYIEQIQTDEEYNIFTKLLEIDMEYGKVINLNIKNVPKNIINTHNIEETINISEEIIEHNIVNDIISRTINEKTYITNTTNNEIAYIDNNNNFENNVINNEKEYITNNEDTVDNTINNEKETVITNTTTSKTYINGVLVDESTTSTMENVVNDDRLNSVYSGNVDVFDKINQNNDSVRDCSAKRISMLGTRFDENIDNGVNGNINQKVNSNQNTVRVLPRTGM